MARSSRIAMSNRAAKSFIEPPGSDYTTLTFEIPSKDVDYVLEALEGLVHHVRIQEVNNNQVINEYTEIL